MRYATSLVIVGLMTANVWGQQDTLASWSFESAGISGSGTAPAITNQTADGGVSRIGSSFTGQHAALSTWSSPSGNGSAHSFSVNNWSVGDYYQFAFSTNGYGSIQIMWDQTASSTGPRDFKVQYSTNGSSFIDPTGTNSTYLLTGDTWSSSSRKTASTRTLDLSTVTGLNDKSTIYIRLADDSTASINGGTVASSGTNRVDNFTAFGTVDASLPVTMKGITAKVDAGRISLSISTAAEIDVVGFNISRSLVKDGPYELISSCLSNPALKASGNPTHGGTYSFVDAKVVGGQTYYYKIESVSKSGATQQAGEILQVQVQLPKDYAVYQNYPKGCVAKEGEFED
ncbi:MAG TPA: hypothetical protein VLX91_01425 [Candidatus Acidoferrales bacterium]|nr:hypothetical protein [Candidatus Acidoferrales bacterium]